MPVVQTSHITQNFFSSCDLLWRWQQCAVKKGNWQDYSLHTMFDGIRKGGNDFVTMWQNWQ